MATIGSMIRTSALVIVLMSTTASGIAHAADSDAPLGDLGTVSNDTLFVTREGVVRAAAARNEMLQASNAMTAAANADALGALRGFLPHLSLGAYRIRTDDALYGFGFKLNQRRATQMDFSAPMAPGMDPPLSGDVLNYPGVSENNIMQIKLQQPIFSGGMAIYGSKAAGAMARAQGSQHQRAVETARFHAVQAYEDLVLATAYEKVMTQAIAAAEGHVRQAQAMVDNEMAIEADLLQARVHRDALKQKLIETRNMIRVAGEHIKLLTAVETQLVIAPDAYDDGVVTDIVTGFLNDGVGLRSDLVASREQTEAAGHMVKVARGAFIPHLNLQAEKNFYHRDELFGNEADSWIFGIYVTWNVFSGLQNVGELKKASAQHHAAEYMQDFQTRQARVEATQAGLDLQAAAEKLRVARDAVEAAREGLRIVTNMYREGLASMVDLLDVQAAATMAEGNLVQARHDYRVGTAKLSFAGGSLNPNTTGTE